MLDDVNVMLVEDEVLIAMDLTDHLEEMGATVVGPYVTLDDALAAEGSADVAVLDVDLHGQQVFPLADALLKRGVPFVFHTGRGDVGELRDRYGDVPVVPKPCLPDELAKTITAVV
ncbi:response regulator [Jannaschia sp. Os4]|uniref:response regulator n=1 Tax=Jannaschia sp. Os4 TaxID=2807617 RepID=UPI001939B63F|nr:response regulator [Jannaschia sp. Os4]MBM2577391.1 response regulator [Jannaschia sp. Os4]